MGIAEGRTFDEVAAIAPALAEDLARGVLAVDWPNGETQAALAGRVEAALTEMVAAGRPVIVVTHAGPLMHARAIAAGHPIRAYDLVPPGVAVRLSVLADGLPASTVLPSRP